MDALRRLRRLLVEQFPDVITTLRLVGGNLTVELIHVHADARGQGVGGRALDAVIAAADRNGWQLDLTPSTGFGADRDRLEGWYSRNGFFVNRGRDHDPLSFEWMRRPARRLVAA